MPTLPISLRNANVDEVATLISRAYISSSRGRSRRPLRGGKLAGVIIAIVVAVLILAIVVFIISKRRARARNALNVGNQQKMVGNGNMNDGYSNEYGNGYGNGNAYGNAYGNSAYVAPPPPVAQTGPVKY